MAMQSAACQQGEVQQEHIKSKCGHSILLDTIMHWTQWYARDSNLLDPLYFVRVSHFTIISLGPFCISHDIWTVIT